MREELSRRRDVSRETLRKLRLFEDLVRKWSPRINLVSPSDIDTLWDRHIRDSAQIFDLAEDHSDWLDLGSGGGFPAIVVAVMGQAAAKGMRTTLVESDRRKCAFLKTSIAALEIDAAVETSRIETLPPQNASTLSARALGPLPDLLVHAHRHLAPRGTALFPKGKNWETELRQAKDKWSFDCDVVQSETKQQARILRIRNIQRI